MSGSVEKNSSENHEGDCTSVVFYNGHVISSGGDGKIKVWDESLNLKKSLQVHDAHIYAMSLNTVNNRLYSSSADGSIKFIDDPIVGDTFVDLMTNCEDEVECLACDSDRLFTGDDKGAVTRWENNKIVFKYNLVEEIKSLVVDRNYIYTARYLDAVVTDMLDGKSGKYTTRGTIAGRSPLALVGPIKNDRRQYLVMATRDGKGLTLVSNEQNDGYKELWTKEGLHEMIIIAICGSDNVLFTTGWDGKVKMWTGLDAELKLLGEATVGACCNSMVMGADSKTVYVACGDGFVRKICF